MTTTLRNIDTDCGLPQVLPTRRVEQVATLSTAGARSDLLASKWGWEQLRDFVNHEIFERFGPQPVIDPAREASIFKGFVSRHGAETARAIAEFAFKIEKGMWRGGPITVYRFCTNSDQYFADVIAARIADATA